MATHGLSPAATLAVADELVPRLGAIDAAWLYATLAPELGEQSDEERIALERAAALAPTAEVLVALGDRLRGGEAAARYESALALDGGSVGGGDRAGAHRRSLRGGAGAADGVGAERATGCMRARLSAARAVLLRDRIGDGAGARQAIERALAEAEPFAELALVARRAHALAGGAGARRPATRARPRRRSSACAPTAPPATTTCATSAELYAERGEHDDVVALLSPLPGSSETLERALEATGRLDELTARLADQAARKPGAEARALYLRAAQLAADRLADPRARRARCSSARCRSAPPTPRCGRASAGSTWGRSAIPIAARAAWPAPTPPIATAPTCSCRSPTSTTSSRELSPAADYYREALARFAVPADDAARVHLRLAEIAHARGDAVEEEQALGQALALGANEALPRLAALHRARGDGAKLAAVLLREAEQATGSDRADLLREAVPYLPADDGARLDEQILLLDPSDEEARDRVLSRLRAAGDAAALMARLEREIPRASHRAAGQLRARARAAGRARRRRGARRGGVDHRAWRRRRRSRRRGRCGRSSGAPARRADAAPLFEAALDDPRLDDAERAELGAADRRGLPRARRRRGARAGVRRARARRRRAAAARRRRVPPAPARRAPLPRSGGRARRRRHRGQGRRPSASGSSSRRPRCSSAISATSATPRAATPRSSIAIRSGAIWRRARAPPTARPTSPSTRSPSSTAR